MYLAILFNGMVIAPVAATSTGPVPTPAGTIPPDELVTARAPSRRRRLKSQVVGR